MTLKAKLEILKSLNKNKELSVTYKDSITLKDKLEELFNSYQANMAGNYPDGNYEEEFYNLCKLNNLDTELEWFRLENENY